MSLCFRVCATEFGCAVIVLDIESGVERRSARGRLRINILPSHFDMKIILDKLIVY